MNWIYLSSPRVGHCQKILQNLIHYSFAIFLKAIAKNNITTKKKKIWKMKLNVMLYSLSCNKVNICPMAIITIYICIALDRNDHNKCCQRGKVTQFLNMAKNKIK